MFLLACACLLFKNAIGRIDENITNREIKKYKKELSKTVNDFISTTNEKTFDVTLKKLEKMMPDSLEDAGMKKIGDKYLQEFEGKYVSIEKDVFTADIKKNIAAEEILEEQIRLLKKKKKKLKKQLKEIRLNKKKWDIFWFN